MYMYSLIVLFHFIARHVFSYMCTITNVYGDMVFHMFKEVMFPEDSHYITIITIHQVVFSLSQLLNKDVTPNPVLHSTLEVVQVFN